jgi:hypothetical protein
MPIVFEEVHTEVSAERGTDTAQPRDAQGAPPLPAQQLEEFRRALEIVDERRARLTAD